MAVALPGVPVATVSEEGILPNVGQMHLRLVIADYTTLSAAAPARLKFISDLRHNGIPVIAMSTDKKSLEQVATIASATVSKPFIPFNSFLSAVTTHILP